MSEPAPIPVLACSSCGFRMLDDALDPFREAGVPVCARCLGSELTPTTMPGSGIVRTFTWYLERIAPECLEPPYNLSFIELDDGPMILAGVEDVEIDQLAIGMRVNAGWRTGPKGENVVRFVP